MKTLIQQSLEEHLQLFASQPAPSPSIEEAGQVIANAPESGNKLMLCGNGGSAAASGVRTIGPLGRDGGALRGLCEP